MSSDASRAVFAAMHRVLDRLERRNRDTIVVTGTSSEQFFAALTKWVEAILDGASSLQLAASLQQFSANGFEITSASARGFSNVAQIPFLRQYMEILATRRAIDSLEKVGVNRIFEISDLLVPDPLTERAADYLGRVARLYIYGFDSESVVLARSVLESALEHAVADEDVAVAGLAPDGRAPSLAQRIVAAERLHLLTKQAARAAHRLRLSGNDVLHVAGSANAVPPVEAITTLGEVLGQLHRPEQER